MAHRECGEPPPQVDGGGVGSVDGGSVLVRVRGRARFWLGLGLGLGPGAAQCGTG